ncbi:MAG: hypothetical protein H6721_17735, partial [Sandaracinus sp.]|nr:hypothetical protein [Sandaracinus sp.]
TEGDGFGTVVRVAGDRLAVGGGRASFCGETWERRGAVFLYREVDGRWVFEQVVLPPPEETTSNFGAALDFDGRRLLVGDPPSYGGETERVFLYDVGE